MSVYNAPVHADIYMSICEQIYCVVTLAHPPPPPLPPTGLCVSTSAVCL